MQHKMLFLGSFVLLTLMFCSINARAQDAPTMPPPYNPYPPLPGYHPPTILPPNLNSESPEFSAKFNPSSINITQSTKRYLRSQLTQAIRQYLHLTDMMHNGYSAGC